jgi:hypothetical protein
MCAREPAGGDRTGVCAGPEVSRHSSPQTSQTRNQENQLIQKYSASPYICLAFAIVYHLSLLSLSLSLIVFLHITDRITGFRITTVLPNANHVSSFMFQSSSISAYCTILYRRRRKLSALQIKPLPRCTLKHQNRGVASCCGPYRRPL